MGIEFAGKIIGEEDAIYEAHRSELTQVHHRTEASREPLVLLDDGFVGVVALDACSNGIESLGESLAVFDIVDHHLVEKRKYLILIVFSHHGVDGVGYKLHHLVVVEVFYCQAHKGVETRTVEHLHE